MKNLIRGLEKIMDLDDGELLRSEVSRKLTNTIMIINGSLFLVVDFIYNQDIVIGYNVRASNSDRTVEIHVNTIDIFTPESGLYITNSGDYLFISKIPKKQWYKSYNDASYNVHRLNNPIRPDRVGWKKVLDIKSIEKKNIILAKNGNIFYHNINVGSILGDKIICSNSLFKQELMDWIRDVRK